MGRAWKIEAESDRGEDVIRCELPGARKWSSVADTQSRTEIEKKTPGKEDLVPGDYSILIYLYQHIQNAYARSPRY